MAMELRWQVGLCPANNRDDPYFETEAAALKAARELSAKDEFSFVGVWSITWHGTDLEYLIHAGEVFRKY